MQNAFTGVLDKKRDVELGVEDYVKVRKPTKHKTRTWKLETPPRYLNPTPCTSNPTPCTPVGLLRESWHRAPTAYRRQYHRHNYPI